VIGRDRRLKPGVPEHHHVLNVAPVREGGGGRGYDGPDGIHSAAAEGQGQSNAVSVCE